MDSTVDLSTAIPMRLMRSVVRSTISKEFDFSLLLMYSYLLIFKEMPCVSRLETQSHPGSHC